MTSSTATIPTQPQPAPEWMGDDTDGRGNIIIEGPSKAGVGPLMELGRFAREYEPGESFVDPSGNTVFLFGPTPDGEAVSVLRPHWTGRWKVGKKTVCRLDIEFWSPYIQVRQAGGFYRHGRLANTRNNVVPWFVCEGVDLPGALARRQYVKAR